MTCLSLVRDISEEGCLPRLSLLMKFCHAIGEKECVKVMSYLSLVKDIFEGGRLPDSLYEQDLEA
jgi:hypothetical protein